MKYRFKIDYIPYEKYHELVDIIRKGEVVDVVGYSEPAGEVVCYYMKGIQINIPLQTFLLVTEEYYEPKKATLCINCKRLAKCRQATTKTRTWLNCGLGTCAIYEPKELPKQPND